jgi:hypothetical protein
LEEAERVAVEAVERVTVGLRVQARLVERLDLKGNAVSPKCSG